MVLERFCKVHVYLVTAPACLRICLGDRPLVKLLFYFVSFFFQQLTCHYLFLGYRTDLAVEVLASLHDDEIDDLVLLDRERMSSSTGSGRPRINCEKMTYADCWSKFRFQKRHMQRLLDALQIPEEIVYENSQGDWLEQPFNFAQKTCLSKQICSFV